MAILAALGFVSIILVVVGIFIWGVWITCEIKDLKENINNIRRMEVK